MNQTIAHVTLVVNDYDEAIAFYTQKLKFELIEDTRLSESKRWVLVKPKGIGSCCLLLAKATDDDQRSRVGDQTGNRVSFFLTTDDFDRDFKNLIDQNILVERMPTNEAYGRVAVFKDLYGNKWDLIQPNKI